MKNDETPRRIAAMHGAMDKGCAGWTPIGGAAPDSPSGHPDASNDPLMAPDAVTDSTGTLPEHSKAEP